jgi:hypothetical protein
VARKNVSIDARFDAINSGTVAELKGFIAVVRGQDGSR